MIIKATLNFVAIFWRLLFRFKLCSTTSSNVLIWDGAALVSSIMVGYDIDFIAIIWCEIYKRAFSMMTTMPFPCLI